jgi:hypothetical protein
MNFREQYPNLAFAVGTADRECDGVETFERARELDHLAKIAERQNREISLPLRTGDNQDELVTGQHHKRWLKPQVSRKFGTVNDEIDGFLGRIIALLEPRITREKSAGIQSPTIDVSLNLNPDAVDTGAVETELKRAIEELAVEMCLDHWKDRISKIEVLHGGKGIVVTHN